MLELQRSALRQKLQIIVASHSAVVLDGVPPEGRIFLDRDPDTGHVRREPVYRDIFQKALYGQSQDRLSILCEDDVAEGMVRGVLDVLNVELSLRPQDIVVGRNTGKNEFPGHIRTLGMFRKLSDFVLVLDGDSRAMENKLKAEAEKYGHSLQPLFLPGDAAPEQWLWDIVCARPDAYAATFGLGEADMKTMTNRAGDAVIEPVRMNGGVGSFVGSVHDRVANELLQGSHRIRRFARFHRAGHEVHGSAKVLLFEASQIKVGDPRGTDRERIEVPITISTFLVQNSLVLSSCDGPTRIQVRPR